MPVMEATRRAGELRREHAHLDRVFSDLVARANSGDWQECDVVWDGFASDLEAHMRFEEQRLFPDYRKIGAGAARTVEELTAAHAAVRRGLERIGVDIQLHLLRHETIEELVAALRAHAEREDRTLYPWLEARETP